MNDKYLKESIDILNRKFGEPLPTLEDTTRAHSIKKEGGPGSGRKAKPGSAKDIDNRMSKAADDANARLDAAEKELKKKKEGVNEGRYHDWRNDESLTPRQKIGRSIREVKNSLKQLSKMIDFNVRLKNELKVNSGSYWKTTHKALNNISERLVKLANKVGKLQ